MEGWQLKMPNEKRVNNVNVLSEEPLSEQGGGLRKAGNNNAWRVKGKIK